MTKSSSNTFVTLKSSLVFSGENIPCKYYSTADANMALYLHAAPFKQGENEDSAGLLLLENGGCAIAVADGMGGMPCGAQASRIVIQSLRASVTRSENGEVGHRESLLDGIEDANSKISELNVGAGSTLAIVAIVEHKLRSFHVGDSEVLVVGQKGKIKLQTIPHTPVGYAMEAGILDEEAALDHGERHLLVNYLGNSDMRIDIGPALKLARHDTVLVGTDGVFDNFSVEELVDIIRKGDLAAVSAELVREITLRMEAEESELPCKPDDVGFILYRRKK